MNGDKLCDKQHGVPNITTVDIQNRKVVWPDIPRTDACYVASVIQKAIYDRQKPLKYLVERGYRVFSQMDVCYPSKNICIFAQLDGLENIIAAYPKAKYVHVKQSNQQLQVRTCDSSMILIGFHFLTY